MIQWWARDDVLIQYSDASGMIHDETFDMVVLSVGMETDEETVELAERLGISLDAHRFAGAPPFAPVETSVSGIYACGAFEGPKDIPSSVMEASAAACSSRHGPLGGARDTDKAENAP